MLQIIIVEFGGHAFSLVPLTLDQWLWSLVFGISELLFGQVTQTCVIFNCKLLVFLPRDATQSALLPRQVVRPSVTLRHCDHIR